jgi:hypothetical protein
VAELESSGAMDRACALDPDAMTDAEWLSATRWDVWLMWLAAAEVEPPTLPAWIERIYGLTEVARVVLAVLVGVGGYVPPPVDVEVLRRVGIEPHADVLGHVRAALNELLALGFVTKTADAGAFAFAGAAA